MIWTPEPLKNPCKTGGVNGQRQSWQWKRKQNGRWKGDREIKNKAKWRRGAGEKVREKCRSGRSEEGSNIVFKYEK